MYPNKQTARIAGALYLIVVLTGIFNLMYVPSKLIAGNDATATFNNIVAAQSLFRFGILSAVACYIAFLLLPLVLYELLKTVDKKYAVLMVVFAVVSVPISFANLQHKYAILDMLEQFNTLSSTDLKNLPAEIMQQLTAYRMGNQVVSIFWGLWLLPFGILVYRSGFLPKILGILLMAGCLGYLINFTGNLLFPYYEKMGVGSFISLPASLGEIGICLWLLVKGIKNSPASASVQPQRT